MKRKLLAIAVGLVFAGVASQAHADNILFDTTGPTVLLPDGLTVSYVDYPGVIFNSYSSNPADPDYAASPIDVDYGTFTASGTSISNTTVNQAYTLNLSVTLPGISGGPISGAINGYFTTIGADNLEFDPSGSYTHTYNTDGIGTVTWTFDSTNIGSTGVVPYSGDLIGQVTYTTYTVPTPASAMGGAALVGLMGLAKIRKNRRLV